MNFIYTRGGDPLVNIAIEELLLDKAPLYGGLARIWIHGPAVVVGVSTPVDMEVDTNLLRRLSIPLVKRGSGGGAVYHDHGNINISLYIPRRLLDVEKIYRMGTELILEILSHLGVEGYRANEGDVAVDGYKVSGSAIWIRSASTLFHATLIVESDVELMKRLTLPRRDLIESGKIDPVKYNPNSLYNLKGILLEEALEACKKVLESRGYEKVVKPLWRRSILESYWGRCLDGGRLLQGISCFRPPLTSS